MQSQQRRSRVGSWWWGAATTASVVGCSFALFTTPLPALLATVVVFAALALLLVTSVETTRADLRQAPPIGSDWRRLVDKTGTATVGAVAVVGLLQVSPGTAALVVGCLAVSAPWALADRHDAAAGIVADPAPLAPQAQAQPSAQPTAQPTAEEAPLPEVTGMSTTELVLAWRRSYAELGQAGSAAEVHRLATRRAQLLDELERRDGLGVQRWLGSGARAASDPSRFLQRPTGPSPV